MMGLVVKHPHERIPIGIDYKCWLKHKATLRSMDANVAGYGSSDTSLLIWAAYISPDGRFAHILVEGGLTDNDYRLTILATASNGLVKENELIVRVKEI